jgi:Tetracyclin repressor-like, C-terminal domain
MDSLKEKYIDYVLTHGKRPRTVYAFAKELGMEEKEFYGQYSSFAHLEAQIWADTFRATVQRIQQDPVYGDYTAREKVLTLYYALIEMLKNTRSFAVFTLKDRSWFGGPDVLGELHKEFREYIKSVINDGIYSGEVSDRPFLTDRYADLYWWQAQFVIRFWAKDTSPEFERTDAAIEKAVNLSFDLLGKNLIDSAFDFAKFTFAGK